ncbi:MAG: acetolactate synthase small subunit [Clostridia bacterium]|nr:acetolactate synthase small subunit [Clostridia bacterium]
MKHTLAVLVENHPGVLSRVSGLFSRRGFNIDSLAVGVTEDPDISRITIVVEGDGYTLEQVNKQLNKLIDVIKISDVSQNSVIRELALIKVSSAGCVRNEIIEIVNVFRANIVDINKNSLTIEITGDTEKIEAMQDMLKPYGIKEMVRTGAIALDRGSKNIKINNEEE